MDAGEIAPSLTWGNSPEETLPVTGYIPSPEDEADISKRETLEGTEYMGLTPGNSLILLLIVCL